VLQKKFSELLPPCCGISPDCDRLRLFIQGESGPLFGIRDTFCPIPEPSFRVPVFAFLYRGKTDPYLRCAPQSLVRKSGYPPALPVSLPPSFYTRRKSCMLTYIQNEIIFNKNNKEGWWTILVNLANIIYLLSQRLTLKQFERFDIHFGHY